MTEILTFFPPTSFLPLQADRGHIDPPVCSFHCYSCPLGCNVGQRAILNVRQCVVSGRRRSSVGLLPNSTVSHQGHKSKLLPGLCNSTAWMPWRAGAETGFEPACVLSRRLRQRRVLQTREWGIKTCCVSKYTDRYGDLARKVSPDLLLFSDPWTA